MIQKNKLLNSIMSKSNVSSINKQLETQEGRRMALGKVADELTKTQRINAKLRSPSNMKNALNTVVENLTSVPVNNSGNKSNTRTKKSTRGRNNSSQTILQLSQNYNTNILPPPPPTYSKNLLPTNIPVTVGSKQTSSLLNVNTRTSKKNTKSNVSKNLQGLFNVATMSPKTKKKSPKTNKKSSKKNTKSSKKNTKSSRKNKNTNTPKFENYSVQQCFKVTHLPGRDRPTNYMIGTSGIYDMRCVKCNQIVGLQFEPHKDKIMNLKRNQCFVFKCLNCYTQQYIKNKY